VSPVPDFGQAPLDVKGLINVPLEIELA
jgi:hypothetical protein